MRASPLPTSAEASAHQFGVPGAPVVDVQAGRLADDQGGPPLGEHPGLQRGQGVRHLVHQRLGEPAERWRPPRDGESRAPTQFRPPTPAPLGRRHPRAPRPPVASSPATPPPGLCRGSTSLQRLEPGNRRYQRRFIQICIKFEHMFTLHQVRDKPRRSRAREGSPAPPPPRAFSGADANRTSAAAAIDPTPASISPGPQTCARATARRCRPP